MNKLIIINKSDLEILDVLTLIEMVVNMGRISNDNRQYCYLTTFTVKNKNYTVHSDLNKGSDKLTVMNDLR